MNVMIAILAVDGEIRAELMEQMLGAFYYLSTTAPGSRLETRRITGARPVDVARNRAVEEFLQTDCEWLVQLDADTHPTRPDFLQIIPLMEQSGKKICTLPTPMWTDLGVDGLQFNVGDLQPDGMYRAYSMMPHGWKEYSLLGGACLVAHRSVFEKVGKPWFRCTKDSRQFIKPESEREYGGGANEDFYFSRKASDAGFRLWVHSDFVCEHHKRVPLLQILGKMNQLRHEVQKARRGVFTPADLPKTEPSHTVK